MSGYPVLFTVLALCSAGALAALLHPFVLLCLRGTDDARRLAARRHARFGVFILFCALAQAADLSLAGHLPNLIAYVAAIVCAGSLALFAFHMRPNALGVAIGLLASVAWLGALLFCLLDAFLEGHSPVTVQLDDGLLCRETVYGFVTTDSGEVMDVYRRYLFIDHRILSQRHSDPEPDANTPPPPAMADTLARCQARVNAARSNASG